MPACINVGKRVHKTVNKLFVQQKAKSLSQ